MDVSYDEIDPDSESDDKIEIDGKDFCDAFKPYGSQVTATEGEVFECKVRPW